LVLDSWLVSFHPNDGWMQQTAALHQNQRVRGFTGSGGLLCRAERGSTNVLL